MHGLLVWARAHLPAQEESERPYECAACDNRFERQPHDCPECGSYQIDWVGWQDDYRY